MDPLLPRFRSQLCGISDRVDGTVADPELTAAALPRGSATLRIRADGRQLTVPHGPDIADPGRYGPPSVPWRIERDSHLFLASLAMSDGSAQTAGSLTVELAATGLLAEPRHRGPRETGALPLTVLPNPGRSRSAA